jgi:eukaryotic-like serine/threonine-protein kinase
VRLAPDQPLSRMNLGFAYLNASRVADARRAFEHTLTLQDSTPVRNGLYVVAVLTDDQALADAQSAAVRGRRDEHQHLFVRAQAAGYKGQMTAAGRLLDVLFERVQPAGQGELTAEALLMAAVSLAVTGRTDLARVEIARLRQRDLLTDETADELVAIAAVLGDAALAAAWLPRAIQHARKTLPGEEAEKAERYLRALAALASGRDQEAYDLARTVSAEPGYTEAPFIVGLAALRMSRWDDASTAFEMTLESWDKTGLSPIVGPTHVMAGRAHAGARRVDAARRAYEEAFRVWKDADADLPILVEARREYERLGT